MNPNTTPQININTTAGKSATAKTAKPEAKLDGLGQVACGWPLALVAIGGAIGGGLGGLAYGINMAIYKSKLPVAAKFVLNPIIGLAAFGGWYAIVQAMRG